MKQGRYFAVFATVILLGYVCLNIGYGYWSEHLDISGKAVYEVVYPVEGIKEKKGVEEEEEKKAAKVKLTDAANSVADKETKKTVAKNRKAEAGESILDGEDNVTKEEALTETMEEGDSSNTVKEGEIISNSEETSDIDSTGSSIADTAEDTDIDKADSSVDDSAEAADKKAAETATIDGIDPTAKEGTETAATGDAEAAVISAADSSEDEPEDTLNKSSVPDTGIRYEADEEAE